MICNLCPRRCNADRPESGPAAAGVCRSPRTAVVARAGLHFWEEPVISGSRGSGAVFFSGCNLHCVYCQNYAISAGRSGTEVSVPRLREIYAELVAQGAHNINLVTPTHFADAVLVSLDPLPPVPVVYNTNGYDLPETLRRFRGKVAVYLPDLKYTDNALARRYSGVNDYFERAVAAIDEMYDQTGDFRFSADGLMQSGVIIRHLMLPGQIENTLKVIDFVARRFRPGQVMFSLMRQYLPCGRVGEREFPELNRRVSDAEYAEAEAALFASGIEDGFLQEAGSAGAEFIPAFDGTGVQSPSR
ncbi:MAG: radical SAM protein [Lentisphaeria bacterium]|nr:radical SAM protein [Lentisphaeria bacterium]